MKFKCLVAAIPSLAEINAAGRSQTFVHSSGPTCVDRAQAEVRRVDAFSEVGRACRSVYLVCATFSMLLGMLYYANVLGLPEHPILEPLKTITLTWFVLLSPPYFPMLARAAGIPIAYTWFEWPPLWHLVGLSGLVVLGYFAGYFQLSGLSVPFCVLGTAFYFTEVALRLPTASARTLVGGFLILVLLTGVVGGHVWNLHYNHPLYFEKILTDYSNKDVLFHSAISNLFNTFGFATTGTDGAASLNYHTGSHFIFAQLSNLLNITPLLFYQLGYMVIVVPLCVANILSLAISYRLYTLPPGGNFKSMNFGLAEWLLAFVAIAGLLPADLLEILGPASWLQLNAESYVTSITCCFILCSMALFHLASTRLAPFSAGRAGEYGLIFAVLPLGLSLTALLKISTAVMILVTIGFVFLRSALYRHVRYWIMVALCLAGIIAVLPLVAPRGALTFEFYPLAFSRTFAWPFVNVWKYLFLPAALVDLMFFYFWAGVFVLLSPRSLRVSSASDYFTQPQQIVVEIMIVLIAVSLFISQVWDIKELSSNGNIFWFISLQHWVGIALVLAIFPKDSMIRLINVGILELLRAAKSIINLPWIAVRMVRGHGFVKDPKERMLAAGRTRLRTPLQHTLTRQSWFWVTNVLPVVLVCITLSAVYNAFWFAKFHLDATLTVRNAFNVNYASLMDVKGNPIESARGGTDGSVEYKRQRGLLFRYLRERNPIESARGGTDESVEYKRQRLLLFRYLREMNHEARDQKRNTALFIPQQNNLYWTKTPDCGKLSFLAQALSGVAMLDGRPSLDCYFTEQKIQYYGFAAYGHRIGPQTLSASDEAQLCRYAEQKGFSKVVVLDEIDHRFLVRNFNCRTRS